MKKFLITFGLILILTGLVFAGGIDKGFIGGSQQNLPKLNVNATLGTELITWTAAGWDEDASTWTFAASTLTHVTGNTTPVTATLGASIVAGTTYEIIVVGTGGGNTCDVTLGGVTEYFILPASGAINKTINIITNTTGSLILTPASTCTISITSISVKALTDATGDVTVKGNLTAKNPILINIAGSLNYPVLSFISSDATKTGFYANYKNYITFTNNGIATWEGEPDLFIAKAKFRADLGTYDAITSITAGSGTGITVNSTGNINRQVYKVTTTYAAYTDTDTTKGIVIATLPAKTKLVGCYADTTTKYLGGAVNAATLEVGITAEGAAEILAPIDVFAAAILQGDADAEMGTSMTRAAAIQGGYLPSWTGTTAVYATIDTTAGNCNALTQGSTTFYLVTERF